MGAELILVTAPVSEKTKVEVVGRIDKMSADELLNLNDYMGYEEENTADEVRFLILDAVNAVVDSDRSDLDTIRFGGETRYITGGMSWGDSPTDSFDSVWLLSESQVTDDEYWKSRE